MRNVLIKEEKPLVAIPKTRRRKLEQTVLSPMRYWKLLYSPLTSGPHSRFSLEEKDLCASCRDSARCTHPRPESGVWHCADYKWEAK